MRIRINRNRYSKKLWLSQDFYIDKLINKFNIIIDQIKKRFETFFFVKTLIKNFDVTFKQNIYIYQQHVKSINYATIIFRSNVTHVFFKLSKFLINSFKSHFDVSIRIFIYLNYIKNFFIFFDVQINDFQIIFLISFDAFYANDSKIRYNSQNYDFKLFNNMIDWKTSKQKTMAINIIEIELLIIFQIDKKLI